MPDQRSPRDAILDVLASAKVKCPFAFEEIAESIMHALAIASADRQPDPAPARILASPFPGPAHEMTDIRCLR